ncbi:MAG: phosphonate C-P lyase system protein PhnK [Rhodospirillaceae bacterium]|nr:phosphonate C-P lyase system protein PhnK [Rhodospirillaceae bacterium]|tara:strand:- start:1692 stop:2465 length:774 start_codon:yes stop_codon:yes gene_type:complete
MAKVLLQVENLSHFYGSQIGCEDVSFAIYPGEILGIVGESGSGKTTVLKNISGLLKPSTGLIEFDTRINGLQEIYSLSEPERRLLMRTDWGVVFQNARDGLRMNVSAGANVGEKLMAVGARNYGDIRNEALDWLTKVEIDNERIDHYPETFSGGMLQRLQIARNLVTKPRLIFMDEPTSGLDVSVQARLLDLIRGLVNGLGIACIIVSHDLGVMRLLSHRLMVMQEGHVVEQGLTDQVLDDPQHPYTQLLVSSILPV